ncbi:MAG: mechanosensitive ion channel family protein [Pyrinomonadaceae bacterium]
MFLQNSNSNSNVPDRVIDNTSYIWSVAYKSIDNLLTSIVERLPYLAAGLVVLIIFWLFGKIVRAMFLSTSRRTHLDERLRILFSRLIGVMIFILGIFAAMTIVIPNFSFGQLIAGLGFTSFIVGFATKDILNNLLSGILILWNRPFQIGDYIFVKDIEGEVEYIGVRATRLKMFDGEQILVPNGDMYSNSLTIRGAGYLQRRKFEISVDYEAKVAQAKDCILSALGKIEEIVKEPAPSVFVTDLAAEGIKLTVYFWVDTDQSSPLQVFDQAASGVNRALREIGIKLYPPRSVMLQNEKAG